MGKGLHQVVAPTEAERLHGDIVEGGFKGKQILGLDPIKELEGFRPWPERIKNDEGVIPGGWLGKGFEGRGEVFGGEIWVVELSGEELEFFEVGIVEVGRAFVALEGESLGFALGGV